MLQRFARVQLEPNLSLSSTPVSIPITMGTNFSEFTGRIDLVALNLSSVAAGATHIHLSISTDPNGDQDLITDTDSRLYDGKTTATKSSASIRPAAILNNYNSNVLYFWVWLNSSTATLDRINITFEEN